MSSVYLYVFVCASLEGEIFGTQSKVNSLARGKFPGISHRSSMISAIVGDKKVCIYRNRKRTSSWIFYVVNLDKEAGRWGMGSTEFKSTS